MSDKEKIFEARVKEKIENKGLADKSCSLKYNTCIPPSCHSTCYNWNIGPILPGNIPSIYPYAVIILNRPITQDPEYMVELWNNASIRITVDGGTTNWDIFLDRLEPEVRDTMKIPDMITGDFDSVTDSILRKYENVWSEIIHTPDQTYTDFTKSLLVLDEKCKDKKIHLSFILAIGQASGRMDQILANIHTLYIARDKKLFEQKTKIYFMSDDALSWLLNPGSHRIAIPAEIKQNGPWCSLVPIGDVCEEVNTTGLRWNLENHCLKFGDLVSTSNTYDVTSEAVKVECSHTLLWSMKLPIPLSI